MPRRQWIDRLAVTAIAGVLGYMAFGGFWHATLFGFLAFSLFAVRDSLHAHIEQRFDELHYRRDNSPQQK